ncbi:hypothetical protein SODALDRAFT_376981 [Sodiomyces alkalinus F11]|uniref:PX domain-containing protein n=1 Tax=Sodiomyces alkalinus (strain CBS 110278 / VKM F-3762 / F11) TaxID=1314773 RepID=A0A3N2Q3G4_SODAK|nr:hypothetical protein SODALDRAFT_376981 [Sodiomyces alkalinus F11]ROT41282.1 hypothetical protein SODALDRAFT_376981 [Sodiomyces alkalinus F11]
MSAVPDTKAPDKTANLNPTRSLNDKDAVLTREQSAALFHILTHHETYAEIEALKHPGTISLYGHPFVSSSADVTKSTPASGSGPSPSPVLQILVHRFLLTLPGARDIPDEFWSVRVQGLLTRFAEADLSESYDKGAPGTRKTLATALSTMVEAIVRGCLGGCPAAWGEGTVEGGRGGEAAYDHGKAEDLERAFHDVLHATVYGTLLDDLSGWLGETADLDSHSPMVGALVEYAILHIATLFHYVFVLSPEGQYLLNLIENVHSMLPYAVIRQTLRMSNAATMMTGMLKLFLSKLSVSSVTNYLGLTKNAEDGMNLLQRIISVILGWDSAESRKTVEQIEKDEKGPSKACLTAIREHVQKPAADRTALRERSRKESKSIVATILETTDPSLVSGLSETHHAQCQEYHANLLSIRDREAITRVLCQQQPDLFTQALRDFVSGFEPYIRKIHDKVDLREHVQDYQDFVDQFIATSKPKKPEEEKAKKTNGVTKDAATAPPPETTKAETRPPSVEDYVALLRKNKHMLYKWLHNGAKQAPEVRDTFRDWAREALVHFRKPGVPVTTKGSSAHTEGTMQERLEEAFAGLAPGQKDALRPVLDEQARYLDAVAAMSRARMQQILDGKTETMAGPGAFLVMWQELLDRTVITPGAAKGPARRGRDVRNESAGNEVREGAVGGMPVAPDVSSVVEALGPIFCALAMKVGEGDDEGSDVSID